MNTVAAIDTAKLMSVALGPLPWSWWMLARLSVPVLTSTEYGISRAQLFIIEILLFPCSPLNKWQVQSRALRLDFDNLPHGHWPSTTCQIVSASKMQKQSATWLVYDAVASSQFAQLRTEGIKSVQNYSFNTYAVATHHKCFIWPVCTVTDPGRERGSIHYTIPCHFICSYLPTKLLRKELRWQTGRILVRCKD